MGISELRQAALGPESDGGAFDTLGDELVRQGVIDAEDMALASVVRRHCDATLDRVLMAEGLASQDALLDAHARRLNSRRLSEQELVNLEDCRMDADPRDLIKHAAMPVVDRDGTTAILTGQADAVGLGDAQSRKEGDEARRVLIADPQAVQSEIAKRNRAELTALAQSRVPEIESCRTWGGRGTRRLAFSLVVLLVLALVVWSAPTLVLGIFVAWAAITLIVSAVMKTAAFVARMATMEEGLPDTSPKRKAPLPKVSILVPLFKETEIAHHLIARLSQLTYPKCLLDVVLILEEEDETTWETLASIDLPSWMRAVVVPDGQPRTKPRAMNYALDFCEGEIVGIFDAEDAPDPDQITTVARRFQEVPDDVVCLQGVLDYYNSNQNWLARCFTIEYATWFRMILPGMEKLGFAIPLGGTTLYFRRDVLEKLGGWDAHNVTEDADLGFRLARHGYRTEMIGTVTGEEANCRLWPWIKQRSRWLKGYMTTYLVHMRRPRLLYRQLGAWKFLGFQAHFITALSQFLLAPLLWTFWLVLFGLPHPLDPVLSRAVLVAFGTLFLIIEAINIAIHLVAVSGQRHRHLIAWVPTMHFYIPLGSFAAYKALYELIAKPFFWEKTVHGLSLQRAGTAGSDDAVDFTGVKLEAGHKSL
ncbi:glycosyltransferase family 2 protein [Roseovarius sp. MMSF_3281]|uniref:glycosyltransferase family 2 protein n=1 Tax=Roseovarius sp. MMSF_3281 TaxID=3046694 RepID=UPI00273FC43C|nr:glycosyltransferase family 2 protein [Roseovarius sp. MMSF_3281]